MSSDASRKAATPATGWTHDERGHVGRPTRKDRIMGSDYSEGGSALTEDEDPRFINMLARGLAVMRAFEFDRRQLGNSEIAEVSGVSKPTVSRLTYTLSRLGYLSYVPEHEKYELAAGVVGLAYPYLAHMPVPMIARPLMEELALKTKTNIGLGVQEGLTVLHLEYTAFEPNPNRRQNVGFRIPLARTAIGRACIAGMGLRQRAALYEEMKEYYGKTWSTLYPELEEAVHQVETRGYCIAAATFRASANSVAVPYLHTDGRTVLAFNSLGSPDRQTETLMHRSGKLMVEMAAEVRRRLAAQPDTHSLGLR